MSIITRSTPPAELSVDNQLSALMTRSVPRILYAVTTTKKKNFRKVVDSFPQNLTRKKHLASRSDSSHYLALGGCRMDCVNIFVGLCYTATL